MQRRCVAMGGQVSCTSAGSGKSCSESGSSRRAAGRKKGRNGKARSNRLGGDSLKFLVGPSDEGLAGTSPFVAVCHCAPFALACAAKACPVQGRRLPQIGPADAGPGPGGILLVEGPRGAKAPGQVQAEQPGGVAEAKPPPFGCMGLGKTPAPGDATGGRSAPPCQDCAA